MITLNGLSTVDKMTNPEISILGTIVFDLFVKNYSRIPQNGEAIEVKNFPLAPGGCGLNPAIALRFLGANVSLFGSIGNDLFGKFILDYLKKFSVDYSSVKITEKFPTSTSVLLINKKGERSYFHSVGASNDIKIDQNDITKILKSKIFHIGGLNLIPSLNENHFSRILRKLKNNNIIISIDLAWDVENKWMKRFKPILPYIDILMGNEKEIKALTSEKKLFNAIKKVHSYGVKIVVAKRGSKGSLVSKEFLIKEIPTIKVESVDSTGAGDLFAGGFLFGILKSLNPFDAAKIGNVMGAIATTEFGSTTALVKKSKHEVIKILNKHYDFDYHI